MSLVAVTAVKKLKTTPTPRVNANPFIGPEPIMYSTTAVISVVTFESKTDVNARLKPCSIAALSVFPARSSSFILSKL